MEAVAFTAVGLYLLGVGLAYQIICRQFGPRPLTYLEIRAIGVAGRARTNVRPARFQKPGLRRAAAQPNRP
jgi:hypothetical protein